MRPSSASCILRQVAINSSLPLQPATHITQARSEHYLGWVHVSERYAAEFPQRPTKVKEEKCFAEEESQSSISYDDSRGDGVFDEFVECERIEAAIGANTCGDLGGVDG